MVIGLSITHLLSGVTELIESRERVRWDGIHLLWLLNALLIQLVGWWGLWTFREQARWGFFSFLFLLLFPVGIYLFSALLLPKTDAEGEIDLRRHYYRNFRWIHSAGALTGVTVVLQNWYFFGAPVFSLYNLNLLLPVLFLLLVLTRNAAAHAAVGLVVLVLFGLVFPFSITATLQ